MARRPPDKPTDKTPPKSNEDHWRKQIKDDRKSFKDKWKPNEKTPPNKNPN